MHRASEDKKEFIITSATLTGGECGKGAEKSQAEQKPIFLFVNNKLIDSCR